jgi:hypothetical protein
MNGKIRHEFTAKIWQHDSPYGWHFVSLPQALAGEIREHLKWQEEGWGRLKANAKIGGCEWKTAIWFDTRHNTYLLPIKAEIRNKENLKVNQEIKVTIWI